MRALACGALLAALHVTGYAATAQVTIDVPPGKLKSVRLRHLPAGTRVAIAVEASSRLGVALVSAAQLKTGHAKALFRAVVERRISFRIAIPESDDYYLVLDNRRGASAVDVTATVRAEARKRKAPNSGGKFDQTRAAWAARA